MGKRLIKSHGMNTKKEIVCLSITHLTQHALIHNWLLLHEKAADQSVQSTENDTSLK